ncbi:MAG TPA: NADH-quinone oxidoreductase subunit NuoF [bacterium]|nr:NADH-quinone oxidoreductase subunit NuoF [bacterium]HPG44692.1 NADH-quinone oxidoreductase subunit NuoF [bacterium]HPM99401.1 NADH-quinone oxidoreductase subunit NuoF [bacterium]
MKSFAKIYHGCWHTPDNPCRFFVDCINNGPHCNQSAEAKEELSAYKKELLLEHHAQPVIMVGMGTCGLANGAQAVYDKLREELTARQIDAQLWSTGCVGFCSMEVIVDIKLPKSARVSYARVTPADVPAILDAAFIQDKIDTDRLLGVYKTGNGKSVNGFTAIDDVPFFKKQKKLVLANCGVINPESIDQYLARDGYRALAKILSTMSPVDVIEEIKKSGLRGRGGGGFPTGKKWEFAYKEKSEQKYLICNADEGDPGAFMDRAVLEGDPHRVVEGMIIAAYAIGASQGYIYCRAEYPLAIQRLEKTIHDAEAYGLMGDNILGSGFSFHLKIKKGAGAFVCGEETALINSIEGKRGMPRPRPPFPAVAGLFGKPTVVNNVETFANVSTIVLGGADAYAAIGTANSKGTKIFALSGKVCNTGLVEVPMGTTLREVIFDIGGGIPNGKEFKAVQIGGPSGGALPESVIDTAVDYESLKSIGAMMGSGGLVVMDETTCMVDLAKYFMTFIASESCGKCIPCREGTKRLLEILERLTQSYRSEKSPEDALLRFQGMVYMERLADVIKNTSLCGLGQTAANPVLSTLRYFRDEYEAHLYDRKCPAGHCRELLTYHIDTDKCTGCTLCARKCPQGAIIGEVKKAHYIIEDKCVRCDICRQNCKFDAIYVE